MSDAINRLYSMVVVARGESPPESKTAKLFRDGRIKIAKKVAEEAVEISLECVTGQRDKVIQESVDLIYNLTVLWAELGVSPSEVWHEMEARERAYGIAGKLPKETEN